MALKTLLGSVLFVMLVTVLVSFPQLPSLSLQGCDSGTYAYMGQLVLHGGLPYVDGWDSKTPLIYYINAAAFYLFGVNLWALWLIQVISFFFTSLCFYVLLCHLYPRSRLVLTGACIFMFQAQHVLLIYRGNYTEQYALLFQVIALVAGYLYLQRPRFYWSFLLGLAASLCFLTRQNAIGIAICFVPILILYRTRVGTGLGGMILGGVLGLGSMVLYFGVKGAMHEAFEAIFVAPPLYHRWLSQGKAVPIWLAVRTTLTAKPVLITMGPLAPLALLGIKVAWDNHLPVRLLNHLPNRSPLAAFHWWVTLSFAADLILSNVNNRGGTSGYEHYFVTPMPTFSLLVIMGLAALTTIRRRDRTYRLVRFAACTYAAIMVIWWLPLAGVMAFSSSAGSLVGPALQHPMARYIEQHTAPSDRVFVWSESGLLNFQSHRDSPSRYFYILPLLAPCSQNQAHARQMVQDLEKNQPVLIIDAFESVIHAVGEEQQESCRKADSFNSMYAFLGKHCDLEASIDEYEVYRCAYQSEHVLESRPDSDS